MMHHVMLNQLLHGVEHTATLLASASQHVAANSFMGMSCAAVVVVP
jgi:hypothetical protein